MALACRPDAFDRGLDKAGDRRTDAVGADDEPGVDAERAAVGAGAGHAVRAAVAAAGEPGDGDAEADVGARFARRRRRGSDRSRFAAARRGASTPFEGLMVIGTTASCVGKRRAVNGRGAGGAHAVEQPPAVELQDAAAHQRVGRRACRRRTASGRRGRRARRGGRGAWRWLRPRHGRRRRPRRRLYPDRWMDVGACRFRSVEVRRRSGGGSAVGASRCRVTTTASAPTPSRKLERRVRWKRWPSTYRPGTGVMP